MMKPLISILFLLLAIASKTTGAVAGHIRRSNLTDDVVVDVNNNNGGGGCPLCTCDEVPSTTSDDIIEASVLMLDVQVSY